jgi:hypothetical protein
MTIAALVEQIKSAHQWHPPDPRTEELLINFEREAKVALPPDMVEFYRICGWAELFDERMYLMALTDLMHVSQAIFDEDTEDYAPNSWWVFCDRRNSDYIGIDLAAAPDGVTPILDVYHDDASSCTIIAHSFTDFLRTLLETNNRIFWLDAACPKLGVLDYDPPTSYWRRVNAFWYSNLGAEIGPSTCNAPGCEKLTIQSAGQCRQHHYETVFKMPCPFPE